MSSITVSASALLHLQTFHRLSVYEQLFQSIFGLADEEQNKHRGSFQAEMLPEHLPVPLTPSHLHTPTLPPFAFYFRFSLHSRNFFLLLVLVTAQF